MNVTEHEEIPDDVAYAEFTFKGVVHRVPMTPEQALAKAPCSSVLSSFLDPRGVSDGIHSGSNSSLHC
jgi:hypothetical protein